MIFLPRMPPKDPGALPAYLQTELNRIADALRELEVPGVEYGLLQVSPVRPREGLVVDAAAGVLGEFEGLYRFSSDGAWHYVERWEPSWLTATGLNVVVGGTPTGSVTDTQAWNDGNALQVPEVSSTPGFDVRLTIPNVTGFTHVVSNIWYTGLLSHQVEYQIYNVTTTTWETLTQVPGGPGYNYRYVGFPNDPADYIDGSGNVIIRVYHVSGGNASHIVYIDFLALVN